MAKKKEQAPKEQAQQTPETNGTAAEAEQVPEIPETVTLTRDEFDQVKNRIDALQKDKDDTVAMAQRRRRILTITASAMPQSGWIALRKAPGSLFGHCCRCSTISTERLTTVKLPIRVGWTA